MGNKKWFGVWALLLVLHGGWCQGQTPADSLKRKHNESVTIYGTANPVIKKVNKLGFHPVLPQIKPATQLNNPLPPVTKWDTQIPLWPIKPGLITVSEKQESWKNVLIAAIGSRISPYAEMYHSGWKKNNYSYQLHIGHHSSFKNIKNYLPSPYTQTEADFSFSKTLAYHKLSLDGHYGYRTYRFYGYFTPLDTATFDQNDTLFRQRNHRARLAVDFRSVYKNFDKLHHSFHVEGNYFSDYFGSSEENVQFRFDLHKAYHAIRGLNQQQLGLEGAYLFYRDKTISQQQTDHFVDVSPYFDARYGILRFHAAIRINWLRQSLSTLHAYPSVKINLEILKNRLSLLAGVDGGLDKNSRTGMVMENPYLSPFVNRFLWQNTRWQFFAGVKGNVAQQVDFSFKASRSSFENRAFFDYDPLYFFGAGSIPILYSTADMNLYSFRRNEFTLRYQSGKVLKIQGHLEWHEASKARVWLDATYRNFDLDNGALPMYQPSMMGSFGLSYQWNSKYMPWITVHYVGQRWAMRRPYGGISPLNMSVWHDSYYELAAYVDVNVGLDVKLNKQSTAFFRITNLLNQQYFRYNDYPVAGLEIMAGIGYKF